MFFVCRCLSVSSGKYILDLFMAEDIRVSHWLLIFCMFEKLSFAISIVQNGLSFGRRPLSDLGQSVRGINDAVTENVGILITSFTSSGVLEYF